MPGDLPRKPGVYFFKDKNGTVIYIGKAKSIKNRIQSYFQTTDDWKVAALIQEFATIDYLITKNETEALLLEAQLIKQHQPKFNVLLKSGQPFVYLLFTKEELPQLKLVRNKQETGTYFGPFLHKTAARRVLHYLLKTFQLVLCGKTIENGCLNYHLGLCSGSCTSAFDKEGYLLRVELAKMVLKKDHTTFLRTIKEQIAAYNEQFAFEKAKNLNEYAQNFDTIFQTIQTRFNEEKFADRAFKKMISDPTDLIDDTTAHELQTLLKTATLVYTIDCFDISHFQSRSIVGSCIRFTNGKPDKNSFRRFTIRSLHQQNDYAALQEIVTRRYKNSADIPDLIVIDGGKGQLSAVTKIFPKAPLVALAKREERLFSAHHPEGILLDVHTKIGKLLIAIRDYAHHFAVSYHKLRRKREIFREDL